MSPDPASPIPWEEHGQGIRLVRLRTVDGFFVTLTEETWTGHILVRHPCMKEHWSKLVETLENADEVHEGRLDRTTVVYSRWYRSQPAIPGECGAGPTLMIFVNRSSRTVKTCYFVDFPEGKLGRKLWPKTS